jgi:hypothetical protein
MLQQYTAPACQPIGVSRALLQSLQMAMCQILRAVGCKSFGPKLEFGTETNTLLQAV